MLRADARPGPAVILTFLDRDNQRQAYPCDRFGWWQDNLYAIAIVLEDLRRAERYGVQSSLIRAGFKALPASTAPALSTEAAADVLAKRSTFDRKGILDFWSVAQPAYRRPRQRRIPTIRPGSTSDFQLVQEAKRVLEAHHGGSL
jgi:D-serine deaminase-like pyridoxal phosphate-dependent protein